MRAGDLEAQMPNGIDNKKNKQPEIKLGKGKGNLEREPLPISLASLSKLEKSCEMWVHLNM